MTYQCDRCLEPIDRVPEGCADPKCPKDDIDELYEQAYGVSYRKESARDAIIVMARRLHMLLTYNGTMTPEHIFAWAELGQAIARLDEMEHTP